jgi:hypothetical protein
MSSTSGKNKLAAGAKKIRKAKKALAASKLSDKKLVPVRDIKQVLRDKVKFLPAHIGVVLSDERDACRDPANHWTGYGIYSLTSYNTGAYFITVLR